MGAHSRSFLSDMKCWVLLLLVCASYVLAQNNCSYTDGSGNTFDLSPLTNDPSQSSPDGYNAQDTAGQTYYINFCQEVSQVSLSACSKTSPSAVCQTSSGNYHPAGSVSTQQFSSAWNDANAPAHEGNFTSGIVVSYTGGDYCSQKGVYRNSKIYVACNEDAEKGECTVPMMMVAATILSITLLPMPASVAVVAVAVSTLVGSSSSLFAFSSSCTLLSVWPSNSSNSKLVVSILCPTTTSGRMSPLSSRRDAFSSSKRSPVESFAPVTLKFK